MGAPANPLAALLGALQARNAMGGVPPGGAPAAVAGGPPGPGGPGPGGPAGGPDAATAFGQMKADLGSPGVDPRQTTDTMKQMKQVLAAMLVHNLEPNPAFAGQLGKIIPMFDRALKELDRAASVVGAVRPSIQMGAAQPTPSSGGPGPGDMGSMGPQGA